MFSMFNWLKIAIITMLLSQHGFVVAKPMNCEEHHKNSSDVHMSQSNNSMHHQSISKDSHQSISSISHHQKENMKDSKHEHADEECEKCKAGDCICCEGGFCASFHLTVFLSEKEKITDIDLKLESIVQQTSLPNSGVYLLPYRPPIIC
ncbi:hypothetical protein [Pseudoalteromonas piratica]|uniref:Uncharacterized protein n=1 Tax=Pseudoalteromonas piratica TaxID=1348114 RepID=A0A0A7EHL5_9GAMM|nr:hypothetical protein [Pseudoalteromonas piratica]AIY66140.1 hypothetical protein OM33_14240 [Pseudoalteromonas piratica]